MLSCPGSVIEYIEPLGFMHVNLVHFWPESRSMYKNVSEYLRQWVPMVFCVEAHS